MRETGICLCPLTRRNCFRPPAGRAYPAFPLIAWVPAFHIKANPFDDGESRLITLVLAEYPQLWWNMKPVYGQGFLQSFGQTAGRARIQVHQLVM